MRRILRHPPSPAMIVACLALAVALGGTSYAAITLPRNSVGTKQLKKNAVTTAKIKSGAVTFGKISRNAVTSSRIKNGSVKGWDVDVATLPPVPKAKTADWAANAVELSGSAASEYVTKLWVHVRGGSADGSHGVISVSHVAPGEYSVVFDRAIRNCAPFATISSSDNVDYSGFPYDGIGQIEPFIVIAPGVENLVGVTTTLPDGRTHAEYDFNLMVVC